MQGFILTTIAAAEKYTLDNSRLDIKFVQSQWSVKSRSRAPGQGACLRSVSRTITMQGFILTANTAAKKLTLFLDST